MSEDSRHRDHDRQGARAALGYRLQVRVMTVRQRKRNNDAALTAAVTEALQLWLQLLRDYTPTPHRQ